MKVEKSESDPDEPPLKKSASAFDVLMSVQRKYDSLPEYRFVFNLKKKLGRQHIVLVDLKVFILKCFCINSFRNIGLSMQTKVSINIVSKFQQCCVACSIVLDVC